MFIVFVFLLLLDFFLMISLRVNCNCVLALLLLVSVDNWILIYAHVYLRDKFLRLHLGLSSYVLDGLPLDTAFLQPATELIKEIAVLELEVVYLEQYLLLLYRKAFDQQIVSISPSKRDERLKSPVDTPRGRFPDVSRPDDPPKVENSAVKSAYCDKLWKEPSGIGAEKLLDSGVHRCHSSLSQRSAFSSRTSPPDETLDKAVRACHSQPLSMMEVTYF